MLRRFAFALVVVVFSVGILIAGEPFVGQITKVDGGKIYIKKGTKAEGEKKYEFAKEAKAYTAAAKVTVNEMALRVTSEAIQVHGGYGFTDEFPVSRFYRGARYGTLGGGTSETLRELIGKRVLAGVDPVDGIFGLGAF